MKSYVGRLASVFTLTEGRAKQTADEMADVLKLRFQEQGWME